MLECENVVFEGLLDLFLIFDLVGCGVMDVDGIKIGVMDVDCKDSVFILSDSCFG